MPSPRHRTKRARKQILRQPGSEPSPYVRGASGLTRPAGSDTYTTDTGEHRYDGRCHPDCPNVR